MTDTTTLADNELLAQLDDEIANRNDDEYVERLWLELDRRTEPPRRGML